MYLRQRFMCACIAGVIVALGFGKYAQGQSCVGYWSSTGYHYSGFSVGQLALFDDGSGTHLYAGGLTYVSGIPAASQPVAVQRWDGTSWSPIVLDVGGQCAEVVVLEDVEGKFLFVEAVGTEWWARILRPSSGWTLPPTGMFSGTYPRAAPLFCFDEGRGKSIFGFSEFVSQGFCFTKWTGTAWEPLVGPLDNPGFSGAISFDDGSGPKLVVIGAFHAIGSVACDKIARWSGSEWTAFAPLPNFGYTRALCTFNDGTGTALYVGGDSQPPAPNTAQPILKWTGQNWVPLTTAAWSTAAGAPQVSAMHVFDDGRGPALFVAGFFFDAAGVPARNLARWDGHAWEAVPGGIGFQTLAMADYNDGRGPSLFLAGSFTTAGGGTSPSIAQYVGCPNCYNNCDASAAAPVLNVNDFMCFLNAYARRDPYANCNVDAVINVADFICFMNKFAVGCP